MRSFPKARHGPDRGWFFSLFLCVTYIDTAVSGARVIRMTKSLGDDRNDAGCPSDAIIPRALVCAKYLVASNLLSDI